jgi:hypothetical protein
MSGTVITGGRGSGGGGNGSVACATTVFNGVVSENLSNLAGIVDWFAFGAVLGAANHLAAADTWAETHTKKDGPGWLAACNLKFVAAGIALGSLNQAGSTTISTDASDSTASTAYASTVGAGMHTPGALGNLGWGWRLGLFVPGDNVSRKFTMWGNQFNLATRLHARLYDAAGTTATPADADNGASATTRQITWEVTYSSPVPTWLEIRAEAITNYTTTSNFKLQAMAIQEV